MDTVGPFQTGRSTFKKQFPIIIWNYLLVAKPIVLARLTIHHENEGTIQLRRVGWYNSTAEPWGPFQVESTSLERTNSSKNICEAFQKRHPSSRLPTVTRDSFMFLSVKFKLKMCFCFYLTSCSGSKDLIRIYL